MRLRWVAGHPNSFLMPRLETTVVKKLWGQERIIVNNDKYCGKVLMVNPGYQCSLHYHYDKDETFLVIHGQVVLETMRHEGMILEEEILEMGDVFHLPANTPHRFRAQNVTGAPAVFIEFSTPHSDEDVIRLEESRAL